jgi:ethanolamine utilization protein EutN
MKIHQVIGSVTLARSHPGYQSARLLACEPLEQSLITGQAPAEPDLVVVWDDLGAGLGHRVAISDGGEAAMPFRPELKAVDAYCSAILDEIFLAPEALALLKTG